MSDSAPTAAVLPAASMAGMHLAQPLNGGRVGVKGAQGVTRLGEVTRHRMAHDPETDETDSWKCGHGVFSSVSVTSQWPDVVWRSANVKANGRCADESRAPAGE